MVLSILHTNIFITTIFLNYTFIISKTIRYFYSHRDIFPNRFLKTYYELCINLISGQIIFRNFQMQLPPCATSLSVQICYNSTASSAQLCLVQLDEPLTQALRVNGSNHDGKNLNSSLCPNSELGMLTRPLNRTKEYASPQKRAYQLPGQCLLSGRVGGSWVLRKGRLFVVPLGVKWI